MMDTNRAMLLAVVEAMGELRTDVVFCGGSIVGLLIDDDNADPTRPTKDVDVIVEVAADIVRYAGLQQRLLDKGWEPGSLTVPLDPLCRFRKGALTLDLMPTEPRILGFAATWAAEAIRYAISVPVDAYNLRVVGAPYFVAMKLEAFNG